VNSVENARKSLLIEKHELIRREIGSDEKEIENGRNAHNSEKNS
jgi:hypothetical protein